jgi:hypothetical protein
METWLSSSSSSDGDVAADGSQRTLLLEPLAAGANVTYSLVAYPPKDNLEGRLYDWSWVAKVCICGQREQQLWPRSTAVTQQRTATLFLTYTMLC